MGAAVVTGAASGIGRATCVALANVASSRSLPPSLAIRTIPSSPQLRLRPSVAARTS